jgi:hypothetical protein
LVSERPKTKQGKLVDKTLGAIIKHIEHKCANDTLAQGSTKPISLIYGILDN